MAADFGFTPYVGDEPFVFISYKTEESTIAAKFALHLHRNGVKVFYDNALEAGDNWAKRLLETIEKRSCCGVILMVSAKSLRSQPVIDEVKTAHYARKTVLGVYIENVTADVQPMKSFLADTHSVAAWKLSDDDACRQVLTGALNMLAGDKTPPGREGRADKQWQTADIYLRNSVRSGKKSDVDSAREQLEAMTADSPADYRGWLGLAMCECLLPVESLDDADRRLDRAADYYSYVVSAGADNTASGRYTEAKTRMWNGILNLLRRETECRRGVQQLDQLKSRAEHMRSHLGHTEGYIADELNGVIAAINTRTEREFFGVCDGELISDTEILLRKYNGSGGSFDIPSEIGGRRVTGIGSEAFLGCTGLTSVVIPDTVTCIGKNAFSGCTGLVSVTIPESVTEISDGAFSRCRSLISVSVPDSVSRIGSEAFLGCRRLTSLTVREDTVIGKRAFAGCRKLTVRSTGGRFSPVAKAVRRGKARYRRVE